MHTFCHFRPLPVFLFLLMASVVSTAGAQTIDEQYEDGMITFDYVQWPFGGMEGTYLADGPVWNEDLSFPEGQDNGCGGGIYGTVGDTTQAVAIGAIQNADGTRDAAVVFVTFPNGPSTGVYPVDTETMSAGFIWIDDATNLTMPQQGDDYQLWFDNLQASHKFGSSNGDITVTAAGKDGFSGTFSGMVGDPDDYLILTVSNGQFGVINVPVSSVPEMRAPARLAAAPNPFNPQTTVKLSMDHEGVVVVEIFDIAGRRVANLHDGLLVQGDHQWIWSGMNHAGVPQSGGVYFCRAEGAGWSTSTKLVLIP